MVGTNLHAEAYKYPLHGENLSHSAHLILSLQCRLGALLSSSSHRTKSSRPMSHPPNFARVFDSLSSSFIKVLEVLSATPLAAMEPEVFTSHRVMDTDEE
jgi:hypothetical protein